MLEERVKAPSQFARETDRDSEEEIGSDEAHADARLSYRHLAVAVSAERRPFPPYRRKSFWFRLEIPVKVMLNSAVARLPSVSARTTTSLPLWNQVTLCAWTY